MRGRVATGDFCHLSNVVVQPSKFLHFQSGADDKNTENVGNVVLANLSGENFKKIPEVATEELRGYVNVKVEKRRKKT